MNESLYRARIEGLQAAERSCVREGLPPRSQYARELGERYARQEISIEQAIEMTLTLHRRIAAHSESTA